MTIPALLHAAVDACEAAGAAIMAIRQEAVAGASAKSDGSPVTAADLAAERVILERLGAADPTIGIVSEESVGDQAASRPPRFWLVDPLDGTREFVAGRDEFAVAIALVEGGRAMLGAIHAPTSGVTWSGAVGVGAWRQDADGTRKTIKVADPAPAAATLLMSRSHRQGERAFALDDDGRAFAVRRMGSAQKFGLIAEGAAQLYVRAGTVMVWDVAAGDAIVTAAGGEVTGFDGAPIDYAAPGLRVHGFVAGIKRLTSKARASFRSPRPTP